MSTKGNGGGGHSLLPNIIYVVLCVPVVLSAILTHIF